MMSLKLDITSKQTQTFDFRYNENIRKLVVNPTSFTSSGIQTGTNLSKITITNHDFENW